jgi:hypothetical protein
MQKPKPVEQPFRFLLVLRLLVWQVSLVLLRQQVLVSSASVPKLVTGSASSEPFRSPHPRDQYVKGSAWIRSDP